MCSSVFNYTSLFAAIDLVCGQPQNKDVSTESSITSVLLPHIFCNSSCKETRTDKHSPHSKRYSCRIQEKEQQPTDSSGAHRGRVPWLVQTTPSVQVRRRRFHLYFRQWLGLNFVRRIGGENLQSTSTDWHYMLSGARVRGRWPGGVLFSPLYLSRVDGISMAGGRPELDPIDGLPLSNIHDFVIVARVTYRIRRCGLLCVAKIDLARREEGSS